jgi:hypothetical protein
MKSLLYSLVIFFAIISSSCKPEECKNLNRDNIIGKWKLVEVSIWKNNQNIVMYNYSKDTIIYDFQTNNRLIITGLADSLQLFGDFRGGEHFYEYRKLEICFHYNIPGPNLNIDDSAGVVGRYFCTALIDKQTMEIGGDINISAINENGEIEGEINYRFNQTLVILK